MTTRSSIGIKTEKDYQDEADSMLDKVDEIYKECEDFTYICFAQMKDIEKELEKQIQAIRDKIFKKESECDAKAHKVYDQYKKLINEAKEKGFNIKQKRSNI